MRSILGGPRILDRRFVPADRMVTTETQPLSQDRSEIPERQRITGASTDLNGFTRRSRLYQRETSLKMRPVFMAGPDGE